MNKNKYILERLLRNGRISVSRLARELNISPTAVKKRIKKLEKEKIIEGYTIIINPIKDFGKVHMFIGVDVDDGSYIRVLNALSNIKDVIRMYSTIGGPDILIELYVDAKEYRKVVERIENITGIDKVYVQIIKERIR